jgi:hypothetical protein
VDQDSPRNGALYNLNASSLIWQQQIRAGRQGILEGISVELYGSAGAQVDVRVRLGEAPSASPILVQERLTKAVEGNELRFVDTTEARIALEPGQLFVMETQGNDTGCYLVGSYVDPLLGPPLYPEPLMINGGPQPPGWRHGFTTYMLPAPCYPNCDASTTPPILNVADFTCFLNRFAAGDPYANCDGSTTAPVLNVADFTCFLNAFAAGCP